MEIGDKIVFNRYEWRVLDIQDNSALVITEDIIEQRAYHDKYIDIQWVDSELRAYLNGEFYNNFTVADKSRIIPITNKNPDNPWFGTQGGVDTKDYVFLLNNRAAAYIHGGGEVGVNGNSVFLRNHSPEHRGGVRPALWLKMSNGIKNFL